MHEPTRRALVRAYVRTRGTYPHVDPLPVRGWRMTRRRLARDTTEALVYGLLAAAGGVLIHAMTLFVHDWILWLTLPLAAAYLLKSTLLAMLAHTITREVLP